MEKKKKPNQTKTQRNKNRSRKQGSNKFSSSTMTSKATFHCFSSSSRDTELKIFEEILPELLH